MQRAREAILHILWAQFLPLMLAYPFSQCSRAWLGINDAEDRKNAFKDRWQRKAEGVVFYLAPYAGPPEDDL